jgi:Ca-activated chloride channel family protein
MTFTWPFALVGLLVVPVLAVVYVAMQRRRRIDSLRYSSVRVVQAAMSQRGSKYRRHVPAAMYLMAVAAMFIGLSRPRLPLPDAERTGTIVLALDVSGSMRAGDVKPTRIDAAIDAIEAFVKKQPSGVRIGMVQFADSAQLVVAPTTDRKAVLQAVRFPRLQRGTNIGDGLQVAFGAILQDFGADAASAYATARKPQTQQVSNPGNATIILLSDGAATTGPPPLDVATQIAGSGIKVFTVGLGSTAAGGTSTIQGPGARGGFFDLDEPTLKGIADKTGGTYYPAKNAGELKHVYDEVSLRTDIGLKTTEITAVAVGASLVLMILAGAMAMLWQNRLP